MRLPGAEHAHVEEKKVTEYLLNVRHPRGGAKAAYFVRFGFTPGQWHAMADALREHGRASEVARVTETPDSVQYTVEGPLTTPDGRNPRVRTVWEVRAGSDRPRLLTAYPCR